MVILSFADGVTGQTLTTLCSFSVTNGQYPYAALVQGSDGNFYSTTWIGGTSANCNGGCGTVFRISPSGTFSSLYSFTGGSDGGSIFGGLVQGTDGYFYGNASQGGVVFRISPSGDFTNLCSVGGSPMGTLVQGRDGAFPPAGLVQTSDGNFYGTTEQGGTNSTCRSCGYGTVFRITPSGSLTTLYTFLGDGSNGKYPEAGLVQGSDGNFYSTTSYGGASTNVDCGSLGCGTVYRITPDGTLTTLHSFDYDDGAYPESQGPGLIVGSDGNFYGTSEEGGPVTNSSGCCYATVFRISPSGDFTNVYAFSGSDGANPVAEPVQGSDGNFYGTTFAGGTTDRGTVFKLSIPLNPPANQISGVQPVESNVVFTIPSVAGETYQLQFSSSMNPTNWVNVPGVSVTNSIGALLTLTNFGGASSQGFYRFDITP